MGGPDFSDQDKLNIRNRIILKHSADHDTDFKTIKIRDMVGNDRILLSVNDAITIVGVPDMCFIEDFT